MKLLSASSPSKTFDIYTEKRKEPPIKVNEPLGIYPYLSMSSRGPNG